MIGQGTIDADGRVCFKPGTPLGDAADFQYWNGLLVWRKTPPPNRKAVRESLNQAGLPVRREKKPGDVFSECAQSLCAYLLESLPVNVYGNVDISQGVPEGCVHLRDPKLIRLCRSLKMACAPAFVGWKAEVPIDGIVVSQADADEVRRRQAKLENPNSLEYLLSKMSRGTPCPHCQSRRTYLISSNLRHLKIGPSPHDPERGGPDRWLMGCSNCNQKFVTQELPQQMEEAKKGAETDMDLLRRSLPYLAKKMAVHSLPEEPISTGFSLVTASEDEIRQLAEDHGLQLNDADWESLSNSLPVLEREILIKLRQLGFDLREEGHGAQEDLVGTAFIDLRQPGVYDLLLKMQLSDDEDLLFIESSQLPRSLTDEIYQKLPPQFAEIAPFRFEIYLLDQLLPALNSLREKGVTPQDLQA